MLHKLIILTIIALSAQSCKSVSHQDLLDKSLDNTFSLTGTWCSINTSYLLMDSTKSILNNPCIERANHRLKDLIEEYAKKELILQRGSSFMDSFIMSHIELYLGNKGITSDGLSSNYKYSNRNMFEDYYIVSQESLYMDWDTRYVCLIEVTDIYYSSNKKKAALGLLNYCGHSEIYMIYYFINIKGTWLIYFIENGD